jgi:hypothetical protein
VALFDEANGYASKPIPPAAAFAAGVSSTERAWRFADFHLDGRTLTTTDTPKVYAWMQVEKIDKRVCQQINRMLNLSVPSTSSTPTSEFELCFQNGTDFHYRKVVASRAGT